MGASTIIEKLTLHINQSIIKESDAVYLMVELRKILDHSFNNRDFSLIRFYADWFLHTEKSRSLENIEPVIKEVYTIIKKRIQNYSVTISMPLPFINFTELQDLKEEMIRLFEIEKLPMKLFEEEEWKIFVRNAIQVLIDQPIINPIDEISEFRFILSKSETVNGLINLLLPLLIKKVKKYGHSLFKYIVR